MNHHLNLYKPYYQADTQQDPIENNLTRALAIAMQNNPLLLYKIIECILEQAYPADPAIVARSIFSAFRSPDDMQLGVQSTMREMEEEEVFEGGVIAVTLTTERFDMSQFSNMVCKTPRDTNRITDIFISVKDTLFIIEVKRNAADCRQQLYDQVHYLKETGNRVRGASISWGDILSILYTLSGMQKIAYEKNVFTEDLIQLLEEHMPGIIPSFPFSEYPFTFDRTTSNWVRMRQRLHQSVLGVEERRKYTVRAYSDRQPVLVDWPWAREVAFWFAEDKKEGPCLSAYIWPANTKGQGAHVYKRSLDWTKKKQLLVGDKAFDLEIVYDVKFCHFNRYISSFQFTDAELAPGMHLHNRENFMETGKYRRYVDGEYNWTALAEWLDDYFVDTFDWRKRCDWKSNFEDSDRSYLTVSFGFQVRCIIPYEHLQQIDKKQEDYRKVSQFFEQIVDAYAHLLD